MRAAAFIVLFVGGCVAGTDNLDGLNDAGVVSEPRDSGVGFADAAPASDSGPIVCRDFPGGSIAGVEAHQADFSLDSQYLLLVTSDGLRVSALGDLDTVAFSQRGIGWAAFTAVNTVVASTRDSGGGRVTVFDSSGNLLETFADSACLSWLTPDRRHVLIFSECDSETGAGALTRGTLVVHRLDVLAPPAMPWPRVRFDSVRLREDGRALLFGSEKQGCGCGNVATDVVEFFLDRHESSVAQTIQGRGVLGHAPTGAAIINGETQCACSLRPTYGLAVNNFLPLGSGTPYIGRDIRRSLDGRFISEWAFAPGSVGKRGILLYTDAFGARPFVPPALNFYTYDGEGERTLATDVALEPEPGNPFPFSFAGKDDEAIIHFDVMGNIVRQESDLPGLSRIIINPPITWTNRFLLSPDREKIAFFAESAGQVPIGALIAGRVDGDLTPVIAGEPFIEVLGFLPQSDGLLFSAQQQLRLVRFDGAPPVVVDPLPLGGLVPVVDRGGCLAAYQVNGAIPELRITRLP